MGNLCVSPSSFGRFSLTGDGTQQPEGRGRAARGRVVVQHALPRRLGQRDGQGDGAVELATPGSERKEIKKNKLNCMWEIIFFFAFSHLGSTVTMGDTATRLPRSLAVSSGEMGWA